MQNRRWSTPYLEFFILWTQKEDSPTAHVPFTERVFNLRGFFRLSTLEIIMNTYQGTLLREYMVSLQKLTQSAYKLMESGQSAIPVVAEFYRLYPIYLVISLSLVGLACIARFWRTNEFFSALRIPKIIYTDVNEDQFNHEKVEKNLMIDRQIDQLTDTPKSYYNLTQNMLLCPLEMIMYLTILGPYILTTMAILALFAGYWQVRMGKANAANRQALNNCGQKLNDSQYDTHINRLTNMFKLARKSKDIEIYTDLIKTGTISIFTLLLMLITSQFLFMGLYDMAMIMAQTATGVQAFLRISKYLGLAKNHMTFNQNSSSQVLAYEFIQNTPIQGLIDMLPKYNWSIYYRVAMYSTLALIGSGCLLLPSTPLVTAIIQLISVVTLKQTLNAGLAAWLISSILLSTTDTWNVGSSTLGILLQMAGLAVAVTNAFSLWPLIPAVIVPAIQAAPLLHSSLILLSLTATYVFDQYALKPLMFALDQIGTWLSQETVMICKIPANTAATMSEKLNDFGNGVYSYSSAAYQYLPSLVLS
jgi:hypothetical protein